MNTVTPRALFRTINRGVRLHSQALGQREQDHVSYRLCCEAPLFLFMASARFLRAVGHFRGNSVSRKQCVHRACHCLCSLWPPCCLECGPPSGWTLLSARLPSWQQYAGPDYHGLSRTITDYHRLSQTEPRDYHRLNRVCWASLAQLLETDHS